MIVFNRSRRIEIVCDKCGSKVITTGDLESCYPYLTRAGWLFKQEKHLNGKRWDYCPICNPELDPVSTDDQVDQMLSRTHYEREEVRQINEESSLGRRDDYGDSI